MNDTHFGARNDSSLFLDYFLTFFEKHFFPYLKENNIKTVLHLGDFLDRRKYVNFNTLSQIRSRFIEPLCDMGIEFHMILGNHDTYYRNTNTINSAKELFLNYDCFTLYEEPYIFDAGEFCIGLVPWICSENEDKVMKFLSTCSCPIVCGHFELKGYEVSRGILFNDGMEDNFLKRFEQVISGHFHNKSSKNNIHYLGTQYEIFFSDLEESKGFHILDTKTRELEFIKNEDKMFYLINIDEIDQDNYNFSKLKNKYVKVIVPVESDKKKSDFILTEVEKNQPYDLNIIEEFFVSEEVSDAVDLAKDTITIINEEIDDLEGDFDKASLKKIIKEIYLETLNNE